MTPSNVELARRGYEAALRGDFETLEEILDPAVKWHGGDPAAPGACQNRGQALDFMRTASARGPVGELVDIVDAGEHVVVILQPAGVPHRVANLTTFRDGKVTEMVHYPTPEEALKAIGR